MPLAEAPLAKVCCEPLRYRRDSLPSHSRWHGIDLYLLGKHPAYNCWLWGGRSSLLESAQEATIRV